MAIAEEGFRQISVEPVSADEHCDYALREEDLPAICAEYERLAEIMKDRHDFNFFHFNVDLTQGPCVIKRIRGCGAGCEYVAVTPEGDIYPCHQFVGQEEYKLGNVHQQAFNLAVSEQFAGLNIYTRNECATAGRNFIAQAAAAHPICWSTTTLKHQITSLVKWSANVLSVQLH